MAGLFVVNMLFLKNGRTVVPHGQLRAQLSHKLHDLPLCGSPWCPQAPEVDDPINAADVFTTRVLIACACRFQARRIALGMKLQFCPMAHGDGWLWNLAAESGLPVMMPSIPTTLGCTVACVEDTWVAATLVTNCDRVSDEHITDEGGQSLILEQAK